MKPLRVLILTETFRPEIGGGERQAAVLGRGLIERGHQVLLLTRSSRPGLAPQEIVDGIRVVRVGPTGPGRRRKWGLVLTVLPALLRLSSSYDVVLVSGFRILAIPALIARHRLGKPVILKADSNGEMSGEFFRSGLASLRLSPESALVGRVLAWRNRLLKSAAAFVAISAEIRAEILAQGVLPERVHRISNGVDTETFRPANPQERAALRTQLNLPDGPLVAYTGRLVSYKGLPVLLEAWRHLRAGGQAGTLLLVGEGGGDMHDCEPELRAAVACCGLADSVRFTGPVSNVEDWLRAADLFVFPTEDEAFGLSLAEAMACGMPVVTTDVGGIKDFAQHDWNAWVVKPRDSAALAAALRALLGDPDRANRLGSTARQTALDRFSAAAIAKAYESLLRNVVAQTQPQAAR